MQLLKCVKHLFLKTFLNNGFKQRGSFFLPRHHIFHVETSRSVENLTAYFTVFNCQFKYTENNKHVYVYFKYLMYSLS